MISRFIFCIKKTAARLKTAVFYYHLSVVHINGVIDFLFDDGKLRFTIRSENTLPNARHRVSLKADFLSCIFPCFQDIGQYRDSSLLSYFHDIGRYRDSALLLCFQDIGQYRDHALLPWRFQQHRHFDYLPS